MRAGAPTSRRVAGLTGLLVAACLQPGLEPALVGASSAAASAPSQLNGSAYGAFVRVGLFGGAPNQVGAAPIAALPPSGGSETASLPKLVAQFGPATIFGGQYEEPGRNPSGRLTVTTRGRTGPGGFVTSSASVVNIGPGPLIADKVSSTCTANEGGVTGSTTFTGGVAETSYDVETQEPKTSQRIPSKPAPNTAVEGTLDHVGDRYRIVFNEQIVKGDTIIVRAAHMYLLGNIAVGDMIVGQSVCGLSPDDGSTAPPTTVFDPNAPTTTLPPTSAPPDSRATSTSGGKSSGGGSGALIAAGAGAGALALAGLLARRRRGRRGEDPPESPVSG